ncbi:MAG TPA: DNA polymerase I [Candidatus Methylacidiphilales bacterium]|jgi:DNA polymerase-1|nr:DNA polymerase I [Candidatus Methylacidiphilales bacterium]
MPDREHTLYLLDGMALVYRAHFAFATNPIRTAAGRNTSAIYGFANTLLELLAKRTPTHLAVVFDTAAPTARHREFPAYKAQRQEMPEELGAAIPDVKRLIRAFNLPVLELDGYEADDIIGTLAREAADKNFTTYMVTPDKDFGQLVNDHVLIYRPSRMSDDAEILGVPEILAKWGVKRTDQVRDILGLWGDTSDNIPGVPGVGEKTAQKLIAQYDSMENLLDHAAEQKGKLRESLEKFRDQALLSKRLATINKEVPIPFESEKLRIGPRDEPALRALFTELEFNSLGRRLFGDSFKAGRGGSPLPPVASPPASEVAVAGPATVPSSGGPGSRRAADDREVVPPNASSAAFVATKPQHPPIPPFPVALRTIDDVKPDYRIVADLNAIREIGKEWEKNKTTEFAVAFDLDSKGAVRGQALCVEPGRAFYFPEDTHVRFEAYFFSSTVVIGHDLKPGLRALGVNFDKTGKWPPFFDTALAHAVVFPDLRHTLEFAAESLLNYTPIPEEKTKGQQDFLAAMDSPDANQLSARRAMERADLALQLHALLVPKLKESGQERVFTEIESPLLPVLAAMENEGIRLDPAALEDVGKKLRADLARLEASIYRHAGTTFNIGSPKQLGEILFGKLALSKDAKKTKTGQYSTDEQTLAALAPLHPIIAEVLEHREASKLLSTYIDALPASIAADGRIHTTFYQLATSTGRLNSQDPNLQNIPIRTAQGREIRRAFVPREGDYQLLSADYSQIELRILAALTQDPGLLDALTGGEDIHRATAARVFGLPPADVTKEQRNQAKMVNYGISYGISAFGLAQRLGIPRADAKNLIDGYFAQYPGIKKYMTDTVAQARERGYVETITGRRRYLPDLRSANAAVRAAAERNAINMPIQGSSADLIKIAMVQIARTARDENWRTKLLLQVHDELVFDLHLPEKERVIEVVRDRMKNALPGLRVPIVVETGLGANWLEAH